MRYALAIFALLLLSSCLSEADYMQPPAGAIQQGSGPIPVNPDKFSVDPKNYPTYRASGEIQPPSSAECFPGGCSPLKMTSILPTDTWRVTHVFKDYYLIESDEYTKREISYLCSTYHHFLTACIYIDEYDYAIYISKDGQITGGWELLPGSKKIFSSREMYLSPSTEKAGMWPADSRLVEAAN